MTQLGKAIGILIRAEEVINECYKDLDLFYASSERYDNQAAYDDRIRRQARRHACAVAGVRNTKLLRRKARKVAGQDIDAWFYRRYGFVPF